MPLFRGAASKAIIANLPNAQQKRLYKSHAAEMANAGFGDDWETARKSLAAMRRAGSLMSLGELDPGNWGIATPISVEAAPPASLILVFSAALYKMLDVALLSGTLGSATIQIEASLTQLKLREARVRLEIV